jgi:hypothetical protein
MKARTLALAAIVCAAVSGLRAVAEPLAPYTAVEVDLFMADRGVAFPADYQSALVDDIGREMTLAYPTLIIVRQGDAIPYGRALLRISGTVIGFKPGSRVKRQFIGFGAGATIVRANVRFADAATGQVLFIRELKGLTWTGISGGDSRSADDSLARKIVKLCKAARLMESN